MPNNQEILVRDHNKTLKKSNMQYLIIKKLQTQIYYIRLTRMNIKRKLLRLADNINKWKNNRESRLSCNNILKFVLSFNYIEMNRVTTTIHNNINNLSKSIRFDFEMSLKKFEWKIL